MSQDLPDRVAALLRLADGPLVLGQRLSEWCGHGPVLEEDIALANIALDLLGQARLLLDLAGRVEDRGRDEDALAFQRGEREFLNPTIVELPNGDFGFTVLRNLLWSAFQQQQWAALAAGAGAADAADAELAAIAAKALKECRYHLEHAADWTERLGDGTDESHGRMQRALDALWPYTAELFHEDPPGAGPSAGIGWASLRAGWEACVGPVLDRATLRAPAATPFLSRGRRGLHSEHLGHLLATMQSLPRAYPGARW